MLTDISALLASAMLLVVMLTSASLYRARAWTLVGMRVAFGNREGPVAPTPLSGRLDRAGQNMVEGTVMLVAAVAAARFAGANPEAIGAGATVFFWARVVYWVVYGAGIAYLRTAIWGVGVGGLGMIALAAVRAS